MIQTTTGIVINGELQLSEPLDLPDRTPVTVKVESLAHDASEAIAAWERTQARLKLRPINGGGKRFSRDELYEGR
jgi:hypothetical protein